MKKIFVIISAVVFISSVLTSCKGHERCAAYGKANRINTEKAFSDKTQKEI